MSSVSLSPLAYLSVFKSATETHPEVSLGVLIGVEEAGEYRVTGAFPMPSAAADGEDREDREASVEGSEAFVKEMLQSLDRMNFEGFPIGVFAAGNVGAFPPASAFALAQTLKLKLVVLADLPVFKALRAAPRAFFVTSSTEVSEVPLSVESSGAAQLLLRENASWLELNVKPKNQRLQNFLERCLDNMGRLVAAAEPGKTPVDKFRATRTALALQQETHRAARALLLPY